jgi:NADH:ubiquinone oxidoreductase subunit E
MEGLDSEIIAEAVSKQEAGGGIAGRIFRQVQRLVSDTRGEPGALIRVLEETQGMLGYLPLPVLKTISRDLKVPLSEICGVASFYHFFTLVPRGKYVIQVCMGTCCYVKGGERILDSLKKEFAIEPGETTADGRFSLETVRCLGCCGLAPVVAIEDQVYRQMTPSKMRDVLSSFEEEAIVGGTL